MPNMHDIADNTVAGGTGLAGEILVFIGAIGAGRDSL